MNNENESMHCEINLIYNEQFKNIKLNMNCTGVYVSGVIKKTFYKLVPRGRF